MNREDSPEGNGNTNFFLTHPAYNYLANLLSMDNGMISGHYGYGEIHIFGERRTRRRSTISKNVT